METTISKQEALERALQKLTEAAQLLRPLAQGDSAQARRMRWYIIPELDDMPGFGLAAKLRAEIQELKEGADE